MPSKLPKPKKETGALRRVMWRRILVPVDFSKTALRALEVAVPLACDHGARLFLLSVIEPVGYMAGVGSVAMTVADSAVAGEARDKLLKIAKRFVPAALPVTLLVDRGRASDGIARATRKQHVDLIVLTTHGRSGLDHFLMGSTAEQVVRQARCPVYVVRGSGKTNRKR